MKKIPLTIYLSDESELHLLNQSLVDTLQFLNQLENHQNDSETLQQSMYWQIRLLEIIAAYNLEE